MTTATRLARIEAALACHRFARYAADEACHGGEADEHSLEIERLVELRLKVLRAKVTT